MASRIQPGWAGRLSQTDFRQSYRRYRFFRSSLLARSFRSVLHHCPRLEIAGAQAAGKNSSLRGQRRQLLFDGFGLFRTGAARIPEAGLWRIGRIWRSRRTLLEWRPQSAQCLFAPALQFSVFAADPRAHQDLRSPRRGPQELALLAATTPLWRVAAQPRGP